MKNWFKDLYQLNVPDQLTNPFKMAKQYTKHLQEVKNKSDFKTKISFNWYS